MNKERTFELLRKRSVTKAVVVFNGGHDEGGVEEILFHIDGAEVAESFPVSYGGRHGSASALSEEQHELSELLQDPVDEAFGSWASVESTYGTVVWDVAAGTVLMEYDQDEPIHHSQEF